MLVKVCGMRDGENIRLVENLSVDLIGFIFYPRSPRYVNSLPEYLPRSAGRVGVFVNEELCVIEDTVIRYGLTHVQLHGSEILQHYTGNVPFLIAGGIGENDAERVLDFRHPQFAGVDLNSRFEVSPGIKDIEKLDRIITKLKR